MGLVPGNDLFLPLEQRAPETAHLRWRGPQEILTESGNELQSQRLVLVIIERKDELFGLPGCRDMICGITGAQQTEQFFSSLIAQAFLGLGEQAPGSVERVIFSSSVAEQFILDPPSTLVELGVG